MSREQVEELNQAIRQRDHQLTSFESSLKELDSESRSKKELEVQVHSLEGQLQDMHSSEQRLKKELSFVEERKANDQVINIVSVFLNR